MQLFLRGRQQEIEITRKKGMKSIRMRVTDAGEIRLSIPYGLSRTAAEQFVLQRTEWLEQALARLEQKAPPMAQEKLENGGTVRIFGAGYEVCRLKKAAELFQIDHAARRLLICVPEEMDEAELRVRFEKWWKAQSNLLFCGLSQKYLPLFADYGVGTPRISVRRMQSRWGSCNAAAGRISLNYYLMRAPMPAIEYIVLHELTHLINQSHNREFYAFIARIMPDWKERRALLENERCC